MTRYGITEWHEHGIEYLAIFVPWCQVEGILGHEYDGERKDLEQVKAATLRAGAPKWTGRVEYDGIEEKGLYLIGGRIVYAEALGQSYHLWDLEDRFGTVEHEGITWYLTQQPYITSAGKRPWYEAIAINANGDTARIVWSVRDDWKDVEDESDACDWSKPAGVTIL